MIHNFTSGISKTLLTNGNYYYPRWSPNGEKILYKNFQYKNSYLNVINSDGTGNRQICKVSGGGWIFHWLNNKTILMIDTTGTNENKIILESDIIKRAIPNKFYSVVDIDSHPEQIIWKPYYGGSTRAESRLVTKSDAVQYINNLTDESPTVYTRDGSVGCIKSIYPFFVPQCCKNSSLRMVLAMKSKKQFNSFGNAKLIQKIYITDKKMDALMFIPQNFMWFDANDGGYPVWSPDGAKVAFDCYRYPYGQVVFICPKEAKSEDDIYVMQKRSSNVKGLKGYYLEGFKMPRWSPDSRFIVCTRIKPTILDKIQPIHLKYNCKEWIYIYDFDSKKGIDLFKGSYPDWH